MKKIISLLLVLSFSLSIAGCTKYASDKELQQLNELKAEVEQLEKEIKAKEQEKTSIQNEISVKDKRLQELETEKAKVQQRLQQIK
jgi:outer membrane murein-binding lipoprotein Lpp